MRKKRGFTLVEILIVIVIIGILIGALVPRMQGAQGRARDVARKNDLSQLQTAILVHYQDHGTWPQMGDATVGMSVDGEPLENDLMAAGLNGLPSDSLDTATVHIGRIDTNGGKYGYLVSKKGGAANGGFVLMAKTETEGASNWIYCGEEKELKQGGIRVDQELDDVKPCSNFEKDGGCEIVNGVCHYREEDQLRYILKY